MIVSYEDHLLGLDFAFVADELPVARDDHYTMAEDGILTTVKNDGVLGNDTDADGDRLTAAIVHPPPFGTLTLLADGSFQYTPNDDFDRFRQFHLPQQRRTSRLETWPR